MFGGLFEYMQANVRGGVQESVPEFDSRKFFREGLGLRRDVFKIGRSVVP